MAGFNSSQEDGSMEDTSKRLEAALRGNLMDHYLDKLNRGEDMRHSIMMLYLISLDMDMNGFFSADDPLPPIKE